MTTELKVYKELTTIQLFEWEVLTTLGIDELDRLLNSESKFLRIGDEIIAKNQIKKVFVRKIESIENFILSQPKDIQERIKARERQKKARIGKGFETIQEVQNFITNNL